MSSSREGKVVKVLSPTEVVVNLGAQDGISAGSEFLIFQYGDDVLDPDTGASLGRLEVVRGRGEPKHIQEKMTVVAAETRTRSVKKLVRVPLTRDEESIAMVTGYRFRPAQEITEDVEEQEPFDNVQVGDLVRVQ